MRLRKFIFIILLSISLCVQAQVGYENYSDDEVPTLDLDSSLFEQMLLYLLERQADSLVRVEDSVEQWQREVDTTTLIPFHLGYRDSVLASVERTEKAYYLRTYGLNSSFLAWQKHYGSPDFALRTDTSFSVWYGNDPRLRKICGTMMLLPQTAIGIENTNDNIPKATLETDKSWMDMMQKDKNMKLKVNTRQKHWYKELTIMLQMTQNFITKNWYTGGNSSLAALGIVTARLDYNDFKRITWENTLELREGTSTNFGDTLRKVNVTEDMLKLYSKFNYKAFSKSYYSVSAELQTQFFDTYKDINSTDLVTSLFSPVRFNLNAGMDFKPVKGLSIAVSPASMKLVHVSDTLRIKQTDFSVRNGKKSLVEIGSSLRVEYSFKPVREFSLDSKLYFYTNYKKVELDLEVVANFIFSQYFSARINLHPRYDNTIILSDDEVARLQFKEFISVGFSHRFR